MGWGTRVRVLHNFKRSCSYNNHQAIQLSFPLGIGGSTQGEHAWMRSEFEIS